MNLNQIQSVIAPIATPAAPAVVLASQLYSGSVEAGTVPILAGVGAVLSGVGMEASGALAFSMTLLSMRRRAWGPMAFGIVGVIAYASFAIIGISQAPKGSTFATFVLMSLVAFLASGLYSYMQEVRKDENVEIAKLNAETAHIQAQKNLANAQARAAKVGTFISDNGGNLPETFRDWRKLSESERKEIATMTTSQVVEKYRTSERTARNWIENSRKIGDK